ncbi:MULTISPECIES: hypothetical protein [Thalassotalea]|uniref:PEP-CTERM sorting domain-containing protein n=1 Tax=Thalassotalea castellviae TaxID=3075612 RepID=A0ABU3A5B7_9GAMM|nr:hypothetical protein [Thalassotalea sp. W431]MDT0604727.1 hypothetical protein [Thalassotalea sp. W431]
MYLSLKKMTSIFIFLSSQFIASHVYASLIVNTDNLLIGADNIVVDGNLYNVRFSDLTGRQLFEQPGGGYDFGPVNDGNKALFSAALLDQVLLGDYDTMPELTFGCKDTDNDTCWIFTAFRTHTPGNIGASVAVNYADSIPDAFSAGNPFPDDHFDMIPVDHFQPNTPNPQRQVWAVWSPVNQQTVPSPDSVWLLFTGIVMLMSKRFLSLS